MSFADLMLGTVSLPVFIYDVGTYYHLWTDECRMFLSIFYMSDFSQASLISAAFISGERFYAIFQPLEQRTLSMRAYRIVIFMVWTLAVLISSVLNVLLNLISG